MENNTPFADETKAALFQRAIKETARTQALYNLRLAEFESETFDNQEDATLCKRLHVLPIRNQLTAQIKLIVAMFGINEETIRNLIKEAAEQA